MSQSRLNDYRISDRKEEIRKTQLYENLDFRQLFVSRFKVTYLRLEIEI